MNSTSRWIPITKADNIPLREGRAVEVDGREIAIFNLGDRFLAVENRCPHRGGPLADGIITGAAVVCPLHAWRVDLEDGSVRKPLQERGCVAHYRVRVEHGFLSVQLPPAAADTSRASAAAGFCPADSLTMAMETAAG